MRKDFLLECSLRTYLVPVIVGDRYALGIVVSPSKWEILRPNDMDVSLFFFIYTYVHSAGNN